MAARPWLSNVGFAGAGGDDTSTPPRQEIAAENKGTGQGTALPHFAQGIFGNGRLRLGTG